jgi:flagellar biosynthesis/type III secretory pathway M-ring protein FliF/YscJ
MKPNFISGLADKLKITWRESTSIEKILSISFLTCLVIVFCVLVANGTTANYIPLLSNSLQTTDVAEIKSYLDSTKTPYQIRDQGIFIPKDLEPQVLTGLYNLHSPINRTDKGFDIFDNNTWIKGEKELQILELRALKGQLEKDISQFENIRMATVILDIPPARAFGASSMNKTKASIILNLKPGARINNQELRAITSHVASAVRGLTTNMIAISDTSGKLYQTIDSEGTFDTMQNAELSVEDHLKAKIDGILTKIVGIDNFYTTVQVVMSRNKITEERKIYNGTINGVSLGDPVVMSVVENPETSSRSPHQGSDNVSQIKEMAIPSDHVTISTSPGKINNISIAVLINKASFRPINQEKQNLLNKNSPDWHAIQTDIQNQLSTILKGYDAKVSQAVNIVDFDLSSTPLSAITTKVFPLEHEKGKILSYYWIIALAVFAGLGTFITLVLLETLWRARSNQENNLKSVRKNPSFDEMVQLLNHKAENHPENITKILRQWLGISADKAAPNKSN